jgi:hypothetical protein
VLSVSGSGYTPTSHHNKNLKSSSVKNGVVPIKVMGNARFQMVLHVML